jgi:hypothetical protein
MESETPLDRSPATLSERVGDRECDRRNPFLFAVGTPRSGTTMLKRMLNAHPEIAMTRETHWIPRYFDGRIGLTPDGFVTPDLPARLFDYHRFPQMKVSREELEELVRSGRRRSYASLVSAIFDRYGERAGKRLVGDKTPEYVRKIPTLHALWPAAKFVHLIRDGRDVCLSMLSWRMAARNPGKFRTWSADPVSTTALWWKAMVRRGREDGAALGSELYYEIRFESLVAQPAEQGAALCAYLGVPFCDAMTRYYEGRTRAGNGVSANQAWLPPTPRRRDWKTQMPAADVARFEAVAGDLLDEMGYARGCPRLAPDVRERAARIFAEFSEDAASREWRLPKNW